MMSGYSETLNGTQHVPRTRAEAAYQSVVTNAGPDPRPQPPPALTSGASPPTVVVAPDAGMETGRQRAQHAPPLPSVQGALFPKHAEGGGVDPDRSTTQGKVGCARTSARRMARSAEAQWKVSRPSSSGTAVASGRATRIMRMMSRSSSQQPPKLVRRRSEQARWSGVLPPVTRGRSDASGLTFKRASMSCSVNIYFHSSMEHY